MKLSFLGKSGDLIYALPAVKALARTHGKVELHISCMAYPLAPLLWEQPYISGVEMSTHQMYIQDEEYTIDGATSEGAWEVFRPEEGMNLSIGSRLKDFDKDACWTTIYAELAGVTLLPSDYFALPNLWNHRQWYYGYEVRNALRSFDPPKTIIFAPESETFSETPRLRYSEIAAEFPDYQCLLIGLRSDDSGPPPTVLRWPQNVVDLRGQTSLVAVSRLVAEARVFIGALSAPFHLARHAGTPSFIFQEQYHRRSLPIDTPYRFYAPANCEAMGAEIRDVLAKEQVTLWDQEQLKAIWA